ncbi:hypothetical protein ACFVSX_04105 [Streptomyces rubiginosohelvolus]|uniref:hypothetical protein n=1 Tax=Streptomyces rubiginosohelvolus TaxID=67362 RepID=UPI0036D95B51
MSLMAAPSRPTAWRAKPYHPPHPARRRPAAVARLAASPHALDAVGDADLRDFLAYDYTEQNALEVVLGIGAYTLSTLANRLTGAPVDEQLAAFAG